MESRTFRQPSCVMVAGGLLALVGAVLSGVAWYHLATGEPLMQGGSKLYAGRHIAKPDELLIGLLGGLPLLVFGLVLIQITLNCAITVDGQGISATNLLRRRCFQAAWAEVTALHRIDPRPGSGYRLTANGKTLTIQTSTVGMTELIAEIRHRSPHLPGSSMG